MKNKFIVQGLAKIFTQHHSQRTSEVA